jgi:hypothetical protein
MCGAVVESEVGGGAAPAAERGAFGSWPMDWEEVIPYGLTAGYRSFPGILPHGE